MAKYLENFIMSDKTILLIGATGQIGWELQRGLQSLGTVVEVTRRTSIAIDLASPDSIRRAVRTIKPAIILNAAAYTAVDKAEQESELAYAINGTALGLLAEESRHLNALLVHYSTDYVFDGNHSQPYTETDRPNPLSIYGASKHAGEAAIQAVGGQYLILRTAWIYGLRGKNFLLTIQRLAKEREELKIVADQMGAPTWSLMVAQATAYMLAQCYSPLYRLDIEALSGIYHLTCAGQTHWYEFAKAILVHTKQKARILPITTRDYPTPAKRPAYSVLSNAKLKKTFGITLPPWKSALELCLTMSNI